jgi:hypothetical protein
VKRIHAKCDIKGRAKLALAAYQTCYHEAPEGRGADPGPAFQDPAKFLRPGLLSQQPS